MVTEITNQIGVIIMSEYSGTTNWEPLREAYSKKTKPKIKKKRKSNVRLRKNRC